MSESQSAVDVTVDDTVDRCDDQPPCRELLQEQAQIARQFSFAAVNNRQRMSLKDADASLSTSHENGERHVAEVDAFSTGADCCPPESLNTPLCAVSAIDHSGEGQAAADEDTSLRHARVALILLLNDWIATYLALVQKLKCLCLRLPSASVSEAMACCNKMILHILVHLCNILNEEAPTLNAAKKKAIGHNWEDMAIQAIHLRNWLDLRIGSYVTATDTVEACVPDCVAVEVQDLLKLSDQSWWIVAAHVNTDDIRRAERRRVTKILNPKCSAMSYIRLVVGSFFYLKDIVTDWLAASAHFTKGRILEAILTLFFVHVAAFWVALRTCSRRSSICAYTLLPAIPLTNNWKLLKLGLAMRDTNTSLAHRIVCRRRFKSIRSENIVLAFIRLTLEDLPQFVLQTQLLLRVMPETFQAIGDNSLIHAFKANWMLLLSIASSFVSICRTDVANVRNRAPETPSGLRGVVAKLATFIFITSFHGGFFIVLTLFLWQCPWCVILPTMLILTLAGFCILMRGSCPTDEPFLMYLKDICSSWQGAALAITAAVRFAVRPLDVFSKWTDVLFCVGEIGVLALLYILCTEEVHTNVFLIAAFFLNALWIAIFAADRKLNFM